MNTQHPCTIVVMAITLAAFMFAAGCQAPQRATLTPEQKMSPSSMTAQSFTRETTQTLSYNYWLYLPPGYSEKESWPLVLFLHGAGERGSDLNRVKIHGPAKLAAGGRDFPFILVAPQCPDEAWWDHATLTALLDEVGDRYAVDRRRVYLTGLSMGGYGTWDLATRQPERFAAIAPICGGGVAYLAARRLKEVPTWVFHGAKDQVVPISESERMVEALKGAGANVRFTVYPEAGHDSWTETYNNPEFYEWLLSHRR